MNGYRLFILIRKNYVEIRHSLLITALIIGIIVCINTILRNLANTEAQHWNMLKNIILIGVTIAASRAFAQMNNRNQNYTWFMTPATTEEKYCAQFIGTTLLWVIGCIALYIISMGIAEGVSALLVQRNSVFNFPERDIIIRVVTNFFIWHAIFFAGASYFRTMHWFKTAIVVGTVFMVIMILTIIFKWDDIQSTLFASGRATYSMENLLDIYVYRKWWYRGRFFLAPILWVLTWVRIRHHEWAQGT